MGIKLNPFTGQFDIAGISSTPPSGSASFKDPVATEAALPTLGNSDGDVRVTLDTDIVWVYSVSAGRWINQQIKSNASIGSTPNASGYSLTTTNVGANLAEISFQLQPADISNPGIITTTSQTISGDKTFTGNVFSANISDKNYVVEKFTLTNTDISNEYVSVATAPSIPANTRLIVISGIEQSYGTDFTVSGNQVIWNGLGLDGVLVAGDELIVIYSY